MASNNFDACIPHIFREEGGLSLRRDDAGNWTGGKVGVGELRGTNYGIAASSHPTIDIRRLTKDQAAGIYRREYWAAADCERLPAGTDLSILDVAVNSGVARGRKYRDQTASITDAVARPKRIAEIRRAFYKGLSTFKTFGKGWLARVARCEAASVAMALAAVGVPAIEAKKRLQAEAKGAAAQASKAAKQASAAGGGAAASPAAPQAAVDAVSPDLWPYVLAAVIAALVIGAAVYLHRKRAHDERAIAFKEAASVL
jgi:lysozyme family protein